ncbi:DUF4376 domain-containing protein [Sphingobacterium multivorum]|uniref:DUF4376 domain-containing protein n=1 Tax=Sphingobacterium multivorum TaxID=28454 RepID=UPI0028AB54C5|nr:hypothetical protein [Sphingobacterium multivorum]
MRRIEGNTGLAYIECVNPIKNRWFVRWDIQPKENEPDLVTYMEEELYRRPELSEIRANVIAYYNGLCDQEILSGLKIEGNTVWLSTENQFNYKAAWDFALAKDGMNLPVTFKLGDDQNPVYRVFETVQDLDGFMITVMGYIQLTLSKYWEIKDSIDWSVYELE